MKKIVFAVSFLLVSCYGFKNISQKIIISNNSNIAVLPLINNSETPMSGFKAKSILENQLFLKKINIVPIDLTVNNDYFTEKEKNDIIKSLKDQNIDYVLYGYINEWRYKTGIDSEPSISLVLHLYDLKTDKIIWSASGSITASSYKSTGIIAQKLIAKLLSFLQIK